MKKTLLLLALLVALINSSCNIEGCLTCSSTPGYCDLCDEVFGYQTASDPSDGCQCRDGFYYDGDPYCYPCELDYANCAACNQNVCTQCKPGTSGTLDCVQPCEAATEGCTTCAGNTCSACDGGRNYTFVAGQCECATEFGKWDDDDLFCVPCFFIFDGCDTCDDYNECLSCKPNFTATSSTQCDCSTGYYYVPSDYPWVASTCQSCNSITGCLDCSGSGACTQCGSAYYLSSGSCIACSITHPSCQTCSPPGGACTQCSDPYLQVAGSCSRCDDSIMGCIGCTSVTSCTSCDTGNNFKGIQNPASSCECIDESYRNSTGCHLCRLSLSNCVQCDSATTCTLCSDGFYQQSGKCESCGTGCTACSSGSVCDTCDIANSFTLQSSRCVCVSTSVLIGQSCIPCPFVITGCQICEDEYECDTCYASGNFLLNSETKKCYCASTRYYSETQNQCLQCSIVLPNCEECSNSTYCDQCATGYTEVHTFGPTQSTCEQCSTLMVGCLVCATPTVCTECDSANNFIFNGSSCQCAPAYYLNSGVCALCTTLSPQCTACTSSGCTACALDYYLNATSKLCQLCTSFSPQCTNCTPTGCSVCADDYVVSGSSCVRLCSISLCIDCFNSTTCQFCVIHATLSADHTKCNCDTGYFSDSTKCALCSTVLPNCAECDSALECTACEDGFVVDLETDECVAFESKLKMASLLLILAFAALSF